MSILTWLIFGLLAASFSYLISPEKDLAGFIQITILSVLGSILGGFLANLMLGDSISKLNFSGFILAALGSLLLIIVPKYFGHKI